MNIILRKSKGSGIYVDDLSRKEDLVWYFEQLYYHRSGMKEEHN